ncbi:MAG: hypothetical protein DMD28_02025 [Gemmatimonadetes bacterium]|nr:MAG: hypothetical protein DMD28_02025 [Gemmatimonadota bacterium]
MNQGPPLANAPRVVRILHTALLGGLILSGATLYLARRLSQPPPVGEARVLTLVLAVVSVGVLVIAVGMLRPRVPERRSEQNPEAYWTDASRAAAIVLWAAIEGAGLVGAVGYFLTAAAAPTVAYALALAALVLFRPGRLEGDGET